MKPLYKLTLTILLVSAIWSCGTRRTEKNRTELTAIATDTVAVQLNTGSEITTATAIKSQSLVNAAYNEENFTVASLDPAQPSSYTNADGQTVNFQNAVITTGKKSGNTASDTKTEINQVQAKKDTAVVKATTGTRNEVNLEQTNKATERESVFTNVWFWVGAALGLCIVLGVVWWFVFGRKKLV